MSYVAATQSWETGVELAPPGVLPAPCPPGDFPQVGYDFDRIAKDVDRDALSRGPASLWRYAAVLPVENPEDAISLGEGWTPLLPLPRLGERLGCSRLLAKDEGRNPSGTFKDRGVSVAVSRLRELGVDTVIHNSSGNAAGAWALYCARAGLNCVNLVPSDILPASLHQCVLAGSRTFVLDGPWQNSGHMVGEAVAARGWTNVGTLKEPYRLEGKKTMGYEIAEQLGWSLPDAIVYPTGGGLGAIAIYKAFEELRALGWIAPGPLPKLIVTQYEGCAPIVRAHEAGADAAELWTDLQVPPGGLKSTRPPGDRAVLKLIRETSGAAIAVTADDAVGAVRDAVRTEGLFPCPEAGTAIAGLRGALRSGAVDPDARIVLLFTGTGLKSTTVFPDPVAPHVKPGDPLDAGGDGMKKE